jgi:hypothetical protein
VKRPTVTFETKVYENDWQYLLVGNYLSKMISRNKFSFDRRVLIINNVLNRSKVEKHARKKVREDVIDQYYFVEDYADDALKFYDLNKSSFGTGYYYSIAEIVGLYVCKTEYLCHYSSDSIQYPSASNWIDESIKLFESNKNILVANPLWNIKVTLKNSQVNSDNFHFANAGFSDQCYLIRKKDFSKNTFKFHHPEADEKYSSYGGELFEKKIYCYMKFHNKHRITFLKSYYRHQNFSKDTFIKKIHFISNGIFLHFRIPLFETQKWLISRLRRITRN